jgi:hypothetical protein
MLTNGIATPTIPAAIAHACLESVPLGKDAALALVDALEPYLEWQSGQFPTLISRDIIGSNTSQTALTRRIRLRITFILHLIYSPNMRL